jgi:anti-sigma B factor antagonist
MAMGVGARRVETTGTVEVEGRLDLRAASEVRMQAAAAIAASGGSLVMDLSAVEFIDSSGLGVLAGLHREAARGGGRLAIVPPAGTARQIFALTRTEGFFTLVPSVEAGRAAVGG